MSTNVKPFHDLNGIFAVPPLARKPGPRRDIDFEQNSKLVRHITGGGITRLLYGGNAFLYHVTLTEFEQLCEWLTSLDEDFWMIPSIGPDYGRALDQAAILRRLGFQSAMVLPCADPRDAAGLERGYREIAEAGDLKLIIYLKDESNFGADREKGLEAVGGLVDDGVCCGIKYAVVRADPGDDPYLDALLKRVDRKMVISGIGERPAVAHMRDWKLPAFTTGSGCVAPHLSRQIFEACVAHDFDKATALREHFIELEDMRDLWGPARVLHAAVELAGIAGTGPITPYISALDAGQREELESIARTLFDLDKVG